MNKDSQMFVPLTRKINGFPLINDLNLSLLDFDISELEGIDLRTLAEDIQTVQDAIIRLNDNINRINAIKGMQILGTDGIYTVIIDNLIVPGKCTLSEGYFQELNGMNGAFMIAPSAKVKNFSQSIIANLPTGQITSASNVSHYSAVINAVVTPNNNDISYWFEYLPTSYGLNFTPTKTPERYTSGPIAVDVSETISGLTAGIEYEVSLVVSWNSGRNEYRSNKYKFTTHPSLPVLATLDATNITISGAKLKGTAQPDGASLTYFFKVWTQNSYELRFNLLTQPDPGETINIELSVTGLKPGQSYFYALCALDSTQQTIVGNTAQFSTSLTTVPTISIPVVSEITALQARLTANISVIGNVTYQWQWWEEAGSLQRGPWVNLNFSTYSTQEVTILATGLGPDNAYFARLVVVCIPGVQQFNGGQVYFDTNGM